MRFIFFINFRFKKETQNKKMIIFLNRLPIPNLKHYCLLSFSLFLLVLLYAYKILNDLNNINNNNNNNSTTNNYGLGEEEEVLDDLLTNTNKFNTNNTTAKFIYKTITNEPWCIWVLINFCYCGFLLISKVIQGIIFGKLRAVENQVLLNYFCIIVNFIKDIFSKAYKRSILEFYIFKVYFHIWCFKFGNAK